MALWKNTFSEMNFYVTVADLMHDCAEAIMTVNNTQFELQISRFEFSVVWQSNRKLFSYVKKQNSEHIVYV